MLRSKVQQFAAQVNQNPNNNTALKNLNEARASYESILDDVLRLTTTLANTRAILAAQTAQQALTEQVIMGEIA